jgi:hypothetical protein
LAMASLQKDREVMIWLCACAKWVWECQKINKIKGIVHVRSTYRGAKRPIKSRAYPAILLAPEEAFVRERGCLPLTRA